MFMQPGLSLGVMYPNPVEQGLAQPWIDRSCGELALQRLDIGGDVHGLDGRRRHG